ncbi:hypothetical protein C8R43DRAFT_965830, partial [Mycena crocata]
MGGWMKIHQLARDGEREWDADLTAASIGSASSGQGGGLVDHHLDENPPLARDGEREWNADFARSWLAPLMGAHAAASSGRGGVVDHHMHENRKSTTHPRSVPARDAALDLRSIRSGQRKRRGSSTTWMKSTTRAGRHPGSVSGRGIDYLWDEPHHSRWTASAGGGGCMDPCCLRWMSWERRQLEALIRKLQKIVSTPTHVTQSPTDELVRIGIRSTAHHRIPKFVMPRTTKKPVRNSRSAVPSQTPSKRGRPINAAKQSTRPSRSSASSHTATKRPPSRRLINASMPRRGPNFKWTFRGQIPLISRLPQELLDHIIHIDISKYKNDWLALIIRRVMLSLVCSHWAKTIDGTPHYWDTLAVYPFMNERFINHCVTRMKSSPLTIRVVLAS